ncbi:hypothetical protein AUEXF2481DRAFT_324962 [Aureobasidium subglaciale EXF-2481]|uniref:Uncharacterized protein n=1 Tax=Aureobasidium subglaciale (strain EXF-2481) TaxID=1043005 RepID=A0A074YBW7_AURSE|nr:uncharacterized protein AUEXF2481DRAFT_324962 [Aureobasidium subglaciale EXF-2481]KEQ93519.1 hypothetical protein AUEXF2481DRAFT_324962 [Aureobasidium subglaciale EXF-2481]
MEATLSLSRALPILFACACLPVSHHRSIAVVCHAPCVSRCFLSLFALPVKIIFLCRATSSQPHGCAILLSTFRLVLRFLFLLRIACRSHMHACKSGKRAHSVWLETHPRKRCSADSSPSRQSSISSSAARTVARSSFLPKTRALSPMSPAPKLTLQPRPANPTSTLLRIADSTLSHAPLLPFLIRRLPLSHLASSCG